jgi:hypothetical protein
MLLGVAQRTVSDWLAPPKPRTTVSGSANGCAAPPPPDKPKPKPKPDARVVVPPGANVTFRHSCRSWLTYLAKEFNEALLTS